MTLQKVLQHAQLVVHGEPDEDEACSDGERESVRVVPVVPDTAHDIFLGGDALRGVLWVDGTEDEDFGADLGSEVGFSTEASAVAFGFEAFFGVEGC